VWDSVEMGKAHPKASPQTGRCKAQTKADNCPDEIRYNLCIQVVRNSTHLRTCGHCVQHESDESKTGTDQYIQNVHKTSRHTDKLVASPDFSSGSYHKGILRTDC
jgi:hypothetical protein